MNSYLFGMPLNMRYEIFLMRMEQLGLSRNGLSDVKRMILQSCLARYDEKTAIEHMRDWQDEKQPKVKVKKWNPGTHYYALDSKFDTYEDAACELRKHGYTPDGVEIQDIRQHLRAGD